MYLLCSTVCRIILAKNSAVPDGIIEMPRNLHTLGAIIASIIFGMSSLEL